MRTQWWGKAQHRRGISVHTTLRKKVRGYTADRSTAKRGIQKQGTPCQTEGGVLVPSPTRVGASRYKSDHQHVHDQLVQLPSGHKGNFLLRDRSQKWGTASGVRRDHQKDILIRQRYCPAVLHPPPQTILFHFWHWDWGGHGRGAKQTAQREVHHGRMKHAGLHCW